MPEKRKQNLTRIKKCFEKLELGIRADKVLRHYDSHIEIETYFRDVLNSLYEWKLDDLNTLFGKSQASIDLADRTAGIAVQVTSDTSPAKIRETFSKFIGKHDKDFNRLVFVYPQLTIPKSTASFSKHTRGFPFNPDSDRICLDDLLTKAQGLGIYKQNKFANLLEAEDGGFENSDRRTRNDTQTNKINQLRDSVIFSELEKRAGQKKDSAVRYMHQIDSALMEFEARVKKLRRFYFETSCDHFANSRRLLHNIEQVLPSANIYKLSNLELYLLVASALVQDICLVISSKNIAELKDDETFNANRQSLLENYGFKNVFPCSSHGGDRIIVADYLRKQGRAESFNLDSCVLVRKITGGNDQQRSLVERICVGQTLTCDAIATQEDLSSPVTEGVQQANIKFLIYSLKVGNLLDINSRRLSPFLVNMVEPLQIFCKTTWDGCKNIKVKELSYRKDIVIEGESPSQESHRFILEWCMWLESECSFIAAALHTQEKQYRLRLGIVRRTIKPKLNGQGRPIYEFHNFRFNLDEERVFKRLFGHQLYGRPDVAFRELIQNAVDATRARVAFELGMANDWNRLSADEKEQRFRHVYTKRKKTLGITIGLDDTVDRTGVPRKRLTVKDQGIGMSRDVIEKYLLKVGRSRWEEDPRLRPLSFRTVGEFGIGFISTFMVSDQIVIETQSCLPQEEGIRASIFGWRGYIATEPLNFSIPGTAIRLLLKDEAVEFFHDLPDSVMFWCPFLELPIRVEAKARTAVVLSPRTLGRMSVRDPHVCIQFADSESILQIQRANYPRSQDTTPALSQDGIVVPEVPPPSAEEPSQQILRWRGLRVDLRGTDRVKLDLSRNLTQESAIGLWQRLVPRIWNGIVQNGLAYQEGRDALGDLLCSVNAMSLGRETLVLRGSQNLQSRDIRRIATGKSMVMVTLGDMSWHALNLDDSCCTVFLPDMDRLNDPLLVFGHAGVPPIPSPPGEKQKQSDDYAVAETLSREVIDAEIPESSPFRQEGVLNYWARTFSSNLFPSLRVSRLLTRLLEKFEYVLPDQRGHAVLNQSHGTQLKNLGAFRLNSEWIALRDPYQASWHFLKIKDVANICDRHLPRHLSWPQYIFFALTQIWAPLQRSWTNCWPNALRLQEKGLKAARVLNDSSKAIGQVYADDDRSYQRFLVEGGYAFDNSSAEVISTRIDLNEIFLDEIWKEVAIDDLMRCLLPEDSKSWQVESQR